jgi:hypothetical protein
MPDLRSLVSASLFISEGGARNLYLNIATFTCTHKKFPRREEHEE